VDNRTQNKLTAESEDQCNSL